MRITIMEPMKWAEKLNIFPLSFAQMVAFKPACTTKKLMRKRPVNAITNFLPMEDVKNSDHFI